MSDKNQADDAKQPQDEAASAAVEADEQDQAAQPEQQDASGKPDADQPAEAEQASQVEEPATQTAEDANRPSANPDSNTYWMMLGGLLVFLLVIALIDRL